MLQGVLSKLMTAGGDDAARAMGGVATRVFDDLMPSTAAKVATKPATKTASKISADTLSTATAYRTQLATFR